MKICISWLRDFVDLEGLSPEGVGKALTMGIAEVEGVHVAEGTDETVLVVDNKSLTHRPDMWGHVGIARELSAILGRPFRHRVLGTAPLETAGPDPSGLRVRVEAPDLCPRYTALVIDGVNGGQSPAWLTSRLIAVGVRPISPVVDLTNYVMLEMGQPLHAFDIKKLAGPEIVVRRARSGEALTTLDGVVRKLGPDDLLIADRDRGIAIAGVMGSLESEIDASTATMVLESATFDPTATRLSAVRVGLRTEAVMRFEKSLDPELPPLAARRFVELLGKVLPEARPLGQLHDSAPGRRPLPLIELSTSFVARRLGTALAPERIDAILRSLEFLVERVDAERARVTPPSFRATKDISIPEDLVEELGRIHGYGNIPPKAPTILMEPAPRNALRALERRVKEALASGLSFDEVMLYSFQSSHGIRQFELDTTGLMKLVNPLSEECAFLKASLMPDLLLLLPKNQPLERFRLFEMARTYHKADRDAPGSLPLEGRHVAGLLYDKAWRSGDAALLEAKGSVESLLARLGYATPAWSVLPADERAAQPWAHPGRAAVASIERRFGLVAEVHPRVLAGLGVSSRAAYFDLDMEELLRTGPRLVTFEELPRFPAVTIDVSVLVPVRTAAQELCSLVRGAGESLVRDVSIVAVYRGANLPEGRKSVSLRLVFRAEDRTLTEAEVMAARDRIVGMLKAKGYGIH